MGLFSDIQSLFPIILCYHVFSGLYNWLPKLQYLGKFVHLATEYLKFLSSFHLWLLKASSQVMSFQPKTPRNYTAKELKEKVSWKESKASWTRRGYKQHRNNRKHSFKGGDVESHGTHRYQKKNKGEHFGIHLTFKRKPLEKLGWKKRILSNFHLWDWICWKDVDCDE